jgi:hypothetical protein
MTTDLELQLEKTLDSLVDLGAAASECQLPVPGSGQCL